MSLLSQKQAAIFFYLLFGGLTTLLNIGLFGLFHDLLSWPVTISYVLAWFLTVLASFLSNRRLVFNSQKNGFKAVFYEALHFYFSRILTGLLGYAVLWLGIHLLHGNPFIWNALSNVIVVVVNFFYSRYFVFKQENQAD